MEVVVIHPIAARQVACFQFDHGGKKSSTVEEQRGSKLSQKFTNARATEIKPYMNSNTKDANQS
jgi:hypothetical protein